MNPDTSDTTTSLFEILHAEDETRLHEYFVPPPEFERITGQRSIIVFGESGSGKTAIFQILKMYCQRPRDKEKENCLLVKWRPVPLLPTINDNLAAVQWLANQVLDSIAYTLTIHLANNSVDFHLTPLWAQKRLVWFIQKNIRGDLTTRLSPLLDNTDPAGAEVIESILSVPVEEILDCPTPEQKVTELLIGMRRLGLNTIWVMSDGLEGWAETDPDQLTKGLVSFLSMLSIFEQPGLVFKFFLPSDLEPTALRASGVARRRLDGYRLKWNIPLLRQMVEKRLSITIGKKGFTLEKLCDAPGLLEWLDRVGKNSPREWIDQVQPLVQYYLQNKMKEPIGETIWKELRLMHPPHFWMRETGRMVRLGGREIPLNDLPPKAYEMLRYLYLHNGEVVGKDELYFLSYLGKSAVPKSSEEEGYEGPNEYIGVIDTSLYRLRQAIEPDPADPVIIQTVRGHGIRLVSRW